MCYHFLQYASFRHLNRFLLFRDIFSTVQSVMPTGALESCATTLTTTVFPTIAFRLVCELCNPSSSSSSASTSRIEGSGLISNTAKQEQLSGNENSNNSGKKRFKLYHLLLVHVCMLAMGMKLLPFSTNFLSQMHLKLYADGITVVANG